MAEKTWQEKFQETLDTSVNLSQAVHVAMGFASVCWEPKPKGIFQSTNAHDAAEMLEKWIEANYTKNNRGIAAID